MYAPDSINELRRLLMSGEITEADVMDAGGENALAQMINPQQMPQPRYDIDPMAQNSMRAENGPEAGKVTSLNFTGAQASQGPQMPQVQSQGAPQGAQQGMKLAGYGGGVMSDLGSVDGPAPQLDMTRPGIEIAGKGKGLYGKDGNVYLQGPEGLTKVLSGYDRGASYEASKRDFLRRKGEQDLAKGEMDIRRDQSALDYQGEQTEALRAQRSIKEDTTSQPYLEKKFGAPPNKNMRWDASGRAVPVAGGPMEDEANKIIEGGALMVGKIDAMIGKRDSAGKLIEGSKPHPGFEGAVGTAIPLVDGLTMWGAQYVPGTDAADFKARLEEVKGGAFLKAFETLKGAGQITQIEGEKATAAITRMGAAQSEAEFARAALEFRDVVAKGIERASAMKSGGGGGGKAFDSMPNPASLLGKRIKAPDGTIYKSDGNRWVRQ